jgi:hypothetical protein
VTYYLKHGVKMIPIVVLLGVGVFVVAIMTRSKHTTSLQTRKEHRVII